MPNQVIYVITVGSYSDYSICAATTNKERAEQLKLFYSEFWNGGARIEEYTDGDPDSGNLQNLRPIFYIHRLANGSWYGDIYKWTNEPFENEFEIENPEHIFSLTSSVFRAEIDAPDYDHALKIAQDHYAQLQAERAGI